MTDIVRRLTHPVADPAAYRSREWIVTNGLGGYASGTVAGIVTRRYHGLLVAALPAPVGRTVMLSHLDAQLRLENGVVVALEPQSPGVPDVSPAPEAREALPLVEFRLECGLPVWRFEREGLVVEKRLLMPHRQNTTHVTYRLLEGRHAIQLELRPFMHVRHYESPLSEAVPNAYTLSAVDGRYEIVAASDLPTLRVLFIGEKSALTLEGSHLPSGYLLEEARGYAHRTTLWSPGYFHLPLGGSRGDAATLVLSTESWDVVTALTPGPAAESEAARRRTLLAQAPESVRTGIAAELVMAADQFLITPAARPEDEARALALGTEARTVIAGYHWFTDWGRDTMISLEGLTLATGREREAALILRTFASYTRHGLIPNMFPDDQRSGLYHTADATLWFFHAVGRYVAHTGDHELLRLLLPVLNGIIDCHIEGTDFGIAVDPSDGLLRQGEDGYQLTWMDAKVEDWVVTPRRGKAVEINALFYNALCLLEQWCRDAGDADRAATIAAHGAQARRSFNERFWIDGAGHLYDVVDGEDGDDAACRPNQLLSIALPHPVLDPTHWARVLEVVGTRLATPFGLRTLSADHPSYRSTYAGDLRARDAAYHQGTVWPWLIGPFVDAWLKTHPDDTGTVRTMLASFDEHLDEAGIGTVSEITDAERPFVPRGCISQAWSVAELLRVTKRLNEIG